MKSSTDFQTGSILLLTATLVCIGLAITVIAPIIDSPLARSAVAQTNALEGRTKSNSPGESLAEFYPPISRAHHQRSHSEAAFHSPVLNVSSQQTELARSSSDTGSNLIPSATGSDFTSFSIEQPLNPPDRAAPATIKSPGAYASKTSPHVTPGAVTPVPPGSVYAPITIHQPAPTSPQSDQNLPLLAERIERLVTERERLAAALESEKQRQSQLAKLEQQKRESEFQRQHISKLETELKSLSQSMAKLQSETSTQLTRLAEQNSQIDVASQALNAYRQALESAKADAARSAERPRTPRTAELIPETDGSPRRQPAKDDAGRVRIPELPPMPTHQHQEPAPAPVIEQKPQTAETPLKRLRVSSPVRTFQAVEPDPEPQFLPLPGVDDEPETSASTKAEDSQSSKTTPESKQEMQFVPLEAPTIREFQSSENSMRRSSLTPSQQIAERRDETKVRQQVIRQTVPDMNVAFEHTYDFNSTPITEPGEEADTTALKVAALPDRVETRIQEQTTKHEFQFEAIEFPDLSINQTPRRELQIPDTLKPVAARVTEIRPEKQVDRKAASEAEVTKTSWLQKLSGTFTRPVTDSKSSSPRTSRPKVGARGQNRHMQRKPVEQGGLKVSLLPSKDQPKEAQSPTSEKPSMLQRISHTVRRFGRQTDK